MAACSEIDTVMKETCKTINPSKSMKSIKEYSQIILSQYPKFTKTIIEIPRYNLSFTPWKEWTQAKSPEWWREGYIFTKHDRTNNFPKANLKNALLSTTALLVSILYYYEAVFKKGDKPLIDAFNAPKLFTVQEAKKQMYLNEEYVWNYTLPDNVK